MVRIFPLLVVMLAFGSVSRAAEIDGIRLPDIKQVDGRILRLNGYGLRAWSVLRIPIYVAGLYLEHPNRDAETIIRSSEVKLLIFRFEHEIGADRAREAWRTGLTNNCAAPCQLDSADMERFLSEIPTMHDGDSFELRFGAGVATITLNGRLLGRVEKEAFADAMLRSFLGPRPGAPEIKQALLSGG